MAVRGASHHLGKNVILLNLYATWCTACEVKLTHLERLHQTYRGRGVVVVGISMDGPETVAMVGPQARRVGVTFPVVLLDEETRNPPPSTTPANRAVFGSDRPRGAHPLGPSGGTRPGTR